jgi:hypothetical protein
MLARNPVSLLSLVAWLKTKDPAQSYPFRCTDGKCLFSQYLNQAFGYDPDPVDADTSAPWRRLHHHYFSVASQTPHTFGAALIRAEALSHVVGAYD